jgi:bifunctional UDP-N-acetylglucosamine pyrophosphorylase / glucosamine-1-phosphate N-acetyltransferase
MSARNNTVIDCDSLVPSIMAPAVDRSLWTAVVPAAGRGSRLGYEGPKILYPVAGKPILHWLCELLSPFCARLVFVVSPAAEQAVRLALAQLAPRADWTTVLQPEPVGMADAVERGLAAVDSAYTLVIWGDQVAVHPRSVETAVRISQGPLRPDALVPTLLRANPYIHFQRDSSGRITEVLQAREGDAMPAHGESDSGLFLFRTGILRERLTALCANLEGTGRRTGELNLLPIVPFMSRAGDVVIAARVVSAEESTGVNTEEEASLVAAHLISRTLEASA